MKRRTFLKTLALLALPIFAGCNRVQAEPRVQHVFIVSFDGGKPAVMQQSAMPTLFEMAKTGAVDWNAKTVFPSVTLPSHTSMLTGVDIPRHKIFWNDYQPKRGVTVLLVEQNAHMALSVADRAYVLETGHIVMSGDAKEIARDPRIKEAYLGA